jgi:hypothetical protein
MAGREARQLLGARAGTGWFSWFQTEPVTSTPPGRS